MILISIIIPVYNAENYLEQCINSVFQQQVQAIEVILIDDGSTDNSLTICNQYAKKDSRIKVIHKINEGAAEARNTGIDSASGKYIMFLDSDDLWCKGYLKAVIKRIQNNANVDVICTRYNKYYGQEVKPTRLNIDRNCIKDKTAEQAFAYILSKNFYECGACATIIKRSLLTDNKLRFPNIKFCEDIDFTPRVILASQKMDLLEDSYYCYRQQVNGKVKHKQLDQKAQDLWTIIKIWDKKLQDENYDKEFVREYQNYLSYQLAILLGMLSCVNQEERKILKREIKENSHILKYALRGKSRGVLLVYQLFELNLTYKIVGVFFKYIKKH